jgi:hypothetical protein
MSGDRLLVERPCPGCNGEHRRVVQCWGCGAGALFREPTAADLVAHLQAHPEAKIATGWACGHSPWARWAISGGEIAIVMPAGPRWFWYLLGADSSGMGECDTRADAMAAADAALVADGWALADGGFRG